MNKINVRFNEDIQVKQRKGKLQRTIGIERSVMMLKEMERRMEGKGRQGSRGIPNILTQDSRTTQGLSTQTEHFRPSDF